MLWEVNWPKSTKILSNPNTNLYADYLYVLFSINKERLMINDGIIISAI